MNPLIHSVSLNRSPEEVFDYLCDLKNELLWNPDMLMDEQLTEVEVGEVTIRISTVTVAKPIQYEK